MMRLFSLLLLSAMASLTSGFLVPLPGAASPRTSVALGAKVSLPNANRRAQWTATAAALIMANIPLIALAAEEEYEYGAVNAPIGIAVGAGILAIATALLPVALRGGEEAFEDIRERDKKTFGAKSNKDVLKKRR